MTDSAIDTLPDGSLVKWPSRSGTWKVGKVLSSYLGLYGLTYQCRARGWSGEWVTQVLHSDIRLLPEGSTRHTRICIICGNDDEVPEPCCSLHNKLKCSEHRTCKTN